MQLNAEDGGNRQCILITNNENNICENITYKRNQLVINGYTDLNNEEVPGLTKNNLRYYRTGFVGRSRSMQNMRKLVNLATDMLCIKENLYTEQNTFGGQKTYKNVFRYFDDGKKQMLIIYREEAIDELVDIIYDMNIPQPIKVYVFSPSEDPWEGSLMMSVTRWNYVLCHKPSTILTEESCQRKGCSSHAGRRCAGKHSRR